MKKLNISADLSLDSKEHQIVITSKKLDVLEVKIRGKSALYIPFAYLKLLLSNEELISRLEQDIIFFQNENQFLKIENGKLIFKNYLTLARYFFKSLFGK